MENLTLHALIQELSESLEQRRCVQVMQIGPMTVAVEFAHRASGRLVLDLTEPQLCFFTEKRWSHIFPGPFVGLLKKWLVGTGLTKIHKNLDERIVHFEFAGDMTPGEHNTLIAELIPRWGNLYLLDAQQRLLGTLLPVRADRRKLAVGGLYSPPHKQGESSLQSFRNRTDFPEILPSDPDELSKHLRGIGPAFAREILHRAQRTQHSPAEILQKWIRDLDLKKFQPGLYRQPGPPETLFLSPFRLECLKDFLNRSYQTVNEMLENAFETRQESILAESGKKEVRKNLQSTLKRFKRIDQKLASEEEAFSREVELQRFGDLILAQPGPWNPVNGKVELVDLLSPRRGKLTVEINPKLNAVANAQRFYEAAKRARRGLEKIKSRHQAIRQTIASSEVALQRLAAATSLSEIEQIEALLPGKTPVTARSAPPRSPSTLLPPSPSAEKKKKCRVFRSSDQAEILVGRNSKENDLVTTRYAQPDDYWFHVADYAGSHVVLRNPRKEILENSPAFLEAAQLAAYFSQARNARKVLVHWTHRKFVKKPKRAKPGLVTLSKFQSITVEPKMPDSKLC